MLRKMSVFEAFANFRLELLPQEWVINLWSTDFYDAKELPSEYELQLDDPDFFQLITNLIEAIEAWDFSDDSSSSWRSSDTFVSLPKSWTVLIERGVDYKALLCIISVFLKVGKKKPLTNRRNIVFISSRLYFVLLSISGSLVFNIFNPILYYQTLQTFMYVMGYVCNEKKKGKHTSSKKNPSNIVLANESDVSHSQELSNVERNMILNEVSLLLDALSKCLKVLHLKDEEESFDKTVQVLVSLTQIAGDNKNVFHNISNNNLKESISRKSFLILEQLCSLNHGEIERIILVIMKYFLPTVVIREEDIKMAIKGNISLNVNTFFFVQRLLEIHEKDAVTGVKAMIQQLCVRMPDRSDIRNKALPQVLQLLRLFEYRVFHEFVVWIISLAHSEKVKYRLSGIELIGKLLNAEISDFVEWNQTINMASDVDTSSSAENGYVNFSSEINEKLLTKLLIAAVISRSLDVSAILRSKCLNTCASLVLSDQKVIKEIMEEFIMKPDSGTKSSDTNGSFPYFNFQDYLNIIAEKLILPKNPLPSVNMFIDVVGSLTGDNNVFVRKNALLLLLNVCLLNKFWLNKNRIEMFLESCLDSSLMMRKFSVKCLTDLILSYPSNKLVIETWVQGVVSLVADNDVKCQEKVIESIGNVVLNNLTDYNGESDEFSKLPWEVLNLIAASGKRNLFKLACQMWSKNQAVTKNIMKIIESHIGTEHNMNAWFLVVCISEFQNYSEPKFISDYFLQNICDLNKARENIIILVVEAVFLNWKGFDKRTGEEIYIKLKDSLESFKVPLTLISRYLDICYVADTEGTKALSGRLVQLCEEHLRRNIAPGCPSGVDESKLCRYIHTLGDAAHFHPGVSADVINYLVDIIDPTSLSRGMTSKWKGTVNSTVKAVSIVTLGKLCLQDHVLAKTYAPVIASVLSVNSKANVKINAMIALSDLCIRFTSVVEDYLGDICSMLKDESIYVRLNCLKLLTQLLQEDYLKPKGALFFYLLITLGDPDARVREITESFIGNTLLKKNPSIMSHFFIQAIFFFNDYEGAGSFSKESLSPKERRVFSMAGATNFNNRGKIYRYMLSNMRDDHRFKLSNRICADILGEVNDGNIPLERVGSAVLKDALFAMACDEMRLENLRKGEEDSSELDEAMVPDDNRSEAVLGIAKKAFISQIVKTNYVEYIVPTISRLKRILSDRKSPLVRDLMICLRELMKDFREEINDILHSDPELAAEVSWDLKNISREEEPPNDIGADFNIKELRVRCERLSAKALSEKMGISITSIKSFQAQSTSSSSSNANKNVSPSQNKSPHAQNRPPTNLSYEKSRRSRRNSRSNSQNLVNKSQSERNSFELVSNPGSSKSSLGILTEEVGETSHPSSSSSSSKKTFDFELFKSSNEINWTPSFHSSPKADKRSSKTRSSLDSECSTSCSSSSYVSTLDSSSGAKKKQSQGNDSGTLENQEQAAGPSQATNKPQESESLSDSPKLTKGKRRVKGKRK